MRKSLIVIGVWLLAAAAACSSLLGLEDTRTSGLDCPPQQADCDGRADNGCEADLSSAATCGACGSACGGAEPLCAASGASFACAGSCEAPLEICGSACTNLADSAANCGRCGHDCGGGLCVGGVCQPTLVADAADALDTPAALAVNATSIFWSERTRVRSCPLPQGCLLAPALIADTYDQLKALAVTDDAVYFSGCRACDDHHDLYRCPVTGCPAVNPLISFTLISYNDIVLGKTRAFWQDTTEAITGCAMSDCAGTDTRWTRLTFGFEDLVSMTSDGDTLYVKGSTMDLRTCPDADGCAMPTALPNSSLLPMLFRVHAGQAYWLAPGPTTGQVRKCAINDCGGGTLFAVDSYGGTELEVDDTGVYWLNPMQGTLRHCALTGCPVGGAGTLATGRVMPKALTLGKGFVYWIEGNTVVKVAKP